MFDGAPLTKVGERVVYFAIKRDTNWLLSFEKPEYKKVDSAFYPQANETYYQPIAGYQSTFMISDGIVDRYVPKGDQGGKYTSLKMTKAKFDQQLANAVKNKK